ncbi:MAG: 2-succinyl-5-enolpyruvyl-6-hydroxy-3-cyclohexene-1-carboxylic-acid synthase [Chloroflexota bacterium]
MSAVAGGSFAAGLRAFVEELVRAGLTDAIVCPGSRSTPMALALAAHPALTMHVLLDERSAAFAALGMAKVARRPVAVLVTSGTAAAELLPAAAEADLARVPLLLLTADRPAELRDRGAAQTIDQVGLFGSHVRWAAEVPLMDGAPETLAQWRWLAGRAMAEAAGTGRGAGPVALNLPYREPLLPDGPLGPEPDLPGAPFVASVEGRRRLDPDDLDALAGHLRGIRRGLIVAGPDDDPTVAGSVARLAAATGYPILADGLAPARALPGAGGGEHLARPSAWLEAHLPELIIRIGAIPTSRPLNELIARAEPELWVLDGEAGWRQPAARPSVLLHADPAATLDALEVRMGRAPDPAGWTDDWAAARAAVDGALSGWLAACDEPFEGLPFAALSEVMREGVLWVGSSMPVRDLDAWWRGGRGVRVVASRGANGIDGVTSAAAGAEVAAAAAGEGPVVLVTGDVSLVHDLGGLVTARLLGAPLTIVLVDNDGGGIFSFLAQAAADRPDVGLPARFEQLFGTPHGTRVGEVATALGATVREVDPRTLRPALTEAIADRAPGVRLLRFPSDRARNVALHRDAAAAAARALEALA